MCAGSLLGVTHNSAHGVGETKDRSRGLARSPAPKPPSGSAKLEVSIADPVPSDVTLASLLASGSANSTLLPSLSSTLPHMKDKWTLGAPTLLVAAPAFPGCHRLWDK